MRTGTKASAGADILLTGRTFDGREARELGICRRTLAADEVVPAAVELWPAMWPSTPRPSRWQ